MSLEKPQKETISPESKEDSNKISNFELDREYNLTKIQPNNSVPKEILGNNKAGESNIESFIKFCFQDSNLEITDKILIKRFLDNIEFVAKNEFDLLCKKLADKICSDLKNKDLNKVCLFKKTLHGSSSVWLAQRFSKLLKNQQIDTIIWSDEQPLKQGFSNIISIDDATYSGLQDSFYADNPIEGLTNLGQYFLFGTKSARSRLETTNNKVFIHKYIKTIGEIFTDVQIARIIEILHQFKYNSSTLVLDRMGEIREIRQSILFFYYAKTPDNLLYEIKKSNKAFVKANYRDYQT
ncbi:MAG: hypothetical protein AAGF07_01160 [Patescibacteria group bacterium]